MDFIIIHLNFNLLSFSFDWGRGLLFVKFIAEHFAVMVRILPCAMAQGSGHIVIYPHSTYTRLAYCVSL